MHAARVGAVLDVDAHRADQDHVLHGADHVVHAASQPGENVRGDRHVHHAHDLARRIEDHLARHGLVVGIAVAERDSRAPGADRLHSRRLEDACARRIPRVGDDEDLGPEVELPEILGLLAQVFHDHAARSSGRALRSS